MAFANVKQQVGMIKEGLELMDEIGDAVEKTFGIPTDTKADDANTPAATTTAAMRGKEPNVIQANLRLIVMCFFGIVMLMGIIFGVPAGYGSFGGGGLVGGLAVGAGGVAGNAHVGNFVSVKQQETDSA